MPLSCTVNISAKIHENHLMCVEVIVCYISVIFFQTQCSSWSTTMLLCVYVWYLGWWYESWHHQQISGVYWY